MKEDSFLSETAIAFGASRFRHASEGSSSTHDSLVFVLSWGQAGGAGGWDPKPGGRAGLTKVLWNDQAGSALQCIHCLDYEHLALMDVALGRFRDRSLMPKMLNQERRSMGTVAADP